MRMEAMRITVEWGVWHAYFSREYCLEMDFGGWLSVEGGKVTALEKTVFPHDEWGPYIHSKTYAPLDGPRWESRVHNWMEGVRITADADEKTVFTLHTRAMTVSFSAGELMERRHLIFFPPPKYAMAVIHAQIEEEGRYWFTPGLRPGQTVIGCRDFDGGDGITTLFTVEGRLIAPGERAEAGFTLLPLKPASSDDHLDTRLRVRYLLSGSRQEEKIRAVARFKVLINGAEVWHNRKFGMWHDVADQFLEEVWADIDGGCLRDGANRAEVVNEDEKAHVLLENLLIEQRLYPHLAVVSSPGWALTGRPFSVTVRSNHPSSLIEIAYDPEFFTPTINGPGNDTHPVYKPAGGMGTQERGEQLLCVGPGEHEFFFAALKPVRNAQITFRDRWRDTVSKAAVGEVWAVELEPVPVKAGFEVKTDSPHEAVEIIRDACRNQLGNLAVFRDYHNLPGDLSALWDAAAYCQKHGIYTDAVCVQEQSVIARASGDRCQSVGSHEHTGIFYGRDRTANTSLSMRDAMRQAVDELAAAVANFRHPGVPVATGDASGGSRCAYMAGFDILRHETFVGHHALILTNARGCVRAFGKRCWGVHAASQHNAQPELEPGLRRFSLGLYLPWVMGCSFAFEEDSLCQLGKYVRNAGEDRMTRGKYEITRQFYKYASTHPRQGDCRVDIAVLQGRYAPPFTGISSANNGTDETAFANDDFPVWGYTGRTEGNWGFRQPEKGYHLLEELAPGIFLPPLRQKREGVRKFFSGDPRGEFDQLPVEAPRDVFARYRFIALLGWHTMEYGAHPSGGGVLADDYVKLVQYAEDGGTLLLAVPHLTTRADREFLGDMEDLKLYTGGDARALCGLKVLGKAGVPFCGRAVCADAGFRFDPAALPPMNRLPNRSPDEDGPCVLADVAMEGAQAVLLDEASDLPLLTRCRVGKGAVYFLCAYAYPGHEALKELMPAVLDAILRDVEASRDVEVADPTGEVYWSVWERDAGSGRVYLLNTDWTAQGNGKRVTLRAGGVRALLEVREGAPLAVCYFEGGLVFTPDAGNHVEIPEKTAAGLYTFRVHGAGGADLALVTARPMEAWAAGRRVGRTQAGELCAVSLPEDRDSTLHEICLRDST